MTKREIIVLAVFILIAFFITLAVLVSAKLAIVIAVGGAGAAIVFFKPFYGLMLYILLTYFRPQDFIPSLKRMRVMLVLAAVLITILFIHKVLRRERIPLLLTRQHVIMLMLLLIVPLSNVANLQLSAAWAALNEFLKVFLPFFVIASLVDDFQKFRTICWTIVICTFLISVNGIIQHYRGVDLMGVPMLTERIVWVNIFGDPNDLALAINSFLPFVLFTVFERSTSGLHKLGLLIIGIAFLTAIYFTNSRGGYMALIMMMAYFAYKRWGLLRGIAIGALFFGAAMVFAPSRMGNVSPYEASASGRVNAWIVGLGLLKSHPIFGVGFHNFILYYGRVAHSAFVECFAELGLIGYFVWLSLLYTCFADLNVIAKHSSSSYALYARIIQLSLVGFLGSALFLSQTYSPILYIIIALATVVVHDPEVSLKRPRLLSGSDVVKVVVILIGSIVLYKILAMGYF